jgi:hypothetical protein
MEINLRNVPFSEELLFFIRRCAGPTSDLQVRLRHIEVPTSVYEVCLRRSSDASDYIVLETDPDVYLAVRNAFEILKARDGREQGRRILAARHVANDAHN